MTEGELKQPRVLHVDDDDDIRAITQIALSVVGGLDVLQCASGEEALEVAEGYRPDLLLLDVMMPDMSGEETLAKLRLLSGLEATPVVFMTAKTHSDDVDHLMELGTKKVISKPFDPLSLANEVVDVWKDSQRSA
ncbi:response regulator [Vannielia litorea]|uniref:response regulator n=1 Tax=Vannielia sp. SX4 TaxID=3463852 RepID=UPI001C93A4A4|nr:response regulator [Vannielia litorea]MBY6075991.1 response regulator [Vannielia litorea]